MNYKIENTETGLKISIPNDFTAEIKDGVIVIEPKSAVLDSWEDLGNIAGYFTDINCDIKSINDASICHENKNVHPSKSECEAATIYYPMLCQLRNRANGDSVDSENWKNYTFALIPDLVYNKVFVLSVQSGKWLKFKTKELALEFAEKHKDLILKVAHLF